MQKLPFILGDSLGAGPAPTSPMNEAEDMQGGTRCCQNNPCKEPCTAVVQQLSHRRSDQSAATPRRSIFCLSPAARLWVWQASTLRLAAAAASLGPPKGTAKPSDMRHLPALSCVWAVRSTARQWAPYRRVCSGTRASMVVTHRRSPPLRGDRGSCPAPWVLGRHGTPFEPGPWGLLASQLVFGHANFGLLLKPILQTRM